jgi:hypothetical protein
MIKACAKAGVQALHACAGLSSAHRIHRNSQLTVGVAMTETTPRMCSERRHRASVEKITHRTHPHCRWYLFRFCFNGIAYIGGSTRRQYRTVNTPRTPWLHMAPLASSFFPLVTEKKCSSQTWFKMAESDRCRLDDEHSWTLFECQT